MRPPLGRCDARRFALLPALHGLRVRAHLMLQRSRLSIADD
jgi:hypothetical protein